MQTLGVSADLLGRPAPVFVTVGWPVEARGCVGCTVAVVVRQEAWYNPAVVAAVPVCYHS